MAHRYSEMILTQRATRGAANGPTGAPAAFKWRDVWYQVD